MRHQRHQRSMIRLSQCIPRLENEVHQAMAVMDADTGKLLNYRQLMQNTKYKKTWSLSSANEFGRLANGIGGRIKKPTNTIEFIFQHKVPSDWMKDVTYQKKLNPIEHGSLWGETGSTTPAPLPPQQRKCWWQNALQQHNLHEGCTLHDNGYF